jgi:Rrf2 family iron-sulfur cluster assembly transcriptional regulator
MEHMRTISLRSLALQQRAKGFAVPDRKARKKGIFKQPSLISQPLSAPNSVFALGQWIPKKA